MSTRSFIGFSDENSKLVGIYCHYDGYPEHVGKVLVWYHNSFPAAEALLEGSHIRSIDNDGTVCRFGPGDGAAEQYDSLEEVLSSVYDYAYLYSVQDNCWKCFGHGHGIDYKTIIEYVIPGNMKFAETC